MTSLFHYLQDTLKVTPLDDDQVQVTVTLPTEHFLHFARILDSLCGLVASVNSRTRLAKFQAAAEALKFNEQCEANQQDYYRYIVERFDRYTAEGLNRNQAIKRIGADLREVNHPCGSCRPARSYWPTSGKQS